MECGVICAGSVEAMAGPGEARLDGMDVRRFQAGVRSVVHPCVEHRTLHTRGVCPLLIKSVVGLWNPQGR